jgi:hypothetical protein
MNPKVIIESSRNEARARKMQQEAAEAKKSGVIRHGSIENFIAYLKKI